MDDKSPPPAGGMPCPGILLVILYDYLTLIDLKNVGASVLKMEKWCNKELLDKCKRGNKISLLRV